MIRLLDHGAVRPSAYNPRLADEARLQLVALSLRKLGFVLPIVADTAGEIVSGHQRHLVAGRLGMEKVPVAEVTFRDEAQRKAINIVFNRGTNDMRVTDHSDALARELMARKVEDLAASLPDAEDPYRCLSAEEVPVSVLAPWARPRYDAHMRNMARTLWARVQFVMPVVATRSGRIVNGIGRVQYASESGWEKLPVVWIGDHEADFAEAMLNLLSMDFDIERRYADFLRHNSFRRARTTRRALGTGFTALVNPGGTTKEFDVTQPANARRWRLAYGSSVVDFGAGHLYETELLRSIGVHVTPFEPYRLGEDNEIDKAASIELARAFLADIASGRRYSSVFLSSVLNSIPFAEDRRKVVLLCAALCDERTRFHVNAMSRSHENYTSVAFKEGEKLSKRRQDTATFMLSYEEGIILGDFMDKPKVQKYHSAEELYDLVKSAFGKCSVKQHGTYHVAVAADPLPIDPARLAEAIEFEFDLPYPDGTRMGLVEEAKAAFGQRLGMKL